jgi:hypothetical protein
MINWSQWLAFVRYGVPELKWVLAGKEQEQHKFVDDLLNDRWAEVHLRLDETWNEVVMNPAVVRAE